MNQSKVGIAQIKAWNVKVFDFASWGHLRVFGVVWGQDPKISKSREFTYQKEALGHVITKKWFSK